MRAILLIGFVISAAALSAETGDLETLAKALQAKQAEIGRREAELARRESELSERERVLAARVSRYEKAIADMSRRLREAQKIQGEAATNVRGIYERMEPKRAAQVLNGMESGLAAAILGTMRKEQAAAILGLMTPAKARRVTELQFKDAERAPSTSVTDAEEPPEGSAP